MKKVLEIEFTGKNIQDIFALPCVEIIWKAQIESMKGQPMGRCYFEMLIEDSCSTFAVGDKIVKYDNNKWGIES